MSSLRRTFRRLSYAQCRLLLGICNVGFWVCVAAVGIALNLPSQFFSADLLGGKPLALALATFLLSYVVLQAPFDLLGGYILPTVYRRYFGEFGDFVASWIRGVVVQMLVLFAIGWTLVSYSEWLVSLVVAWMLVLLLLQSLLARTVGHFDLRGDVGWKSFDEAFNGGFAGLPFFQTAIFVTGRGQRLRQMDEKRRLYLERMRLPLAGLVIALTFNVVGVLLVQPLVASPLNTVSGVVELALWFTLWSFLGLLVLPSLSRRAVYAGDYALYSKGIRGEEFTHYLEHDRSQAEDESRSVWIERIFHPVPNPRDRAMRWGKCPAWAGGWHAARYAIYLSWAGLSLLNRSVHCNIGKPNVWVMLPCE